MASKNNKSHSNASAKTSSVSPATHKRHDGLEDSLSKFFTPLTEGRTRGSANLPPVIDDGSRSTGAFSSSGNAKKKSAPFTSRGRRKSGGNCAPEGAGSSTRSAKNASSSARRHHSDEEEEVVDRKRFMQPLSVEISKEETASTSRTNDPRLSSGGSSGQSRQTGQLIDSLSSYFSTTTERRHTFQKGEYAKLLSSSARKKRRIGASESSTAREEEEETDPEMTSPRRSPKSRKKKLSRDLVAPASASSSTGAGTSGMMPSTSEAGNVPASSFDSALSRKPSTASRLSEASESGIGEWRPGGRSTQNSASAALFAGTSSSSQTPNKKIKNRERAQSSSSSRSTSRKGTRRVPKDGESPDPSSPASKTKSSRQSRGSKSCKEEIKNEKLRKWKRKDSQIEEREDGEEKEAFTPIKTPVDTPVNTPVASTSGTPGRTSKTLFKSGMRKSRGPFATMATAGLGSMAERLEKKEDDEIYEEVPSGSKQRTPSLEKASTSAEGVLVPSSSYVPEWSGIKIPPETWARFEEITRQANAAIPRVPELNPDGSAGHWPHRIVIGKHIMDTCYTAPYPNELAYVEQLYICVYCLQYMRTNDTLNRHLLKCKWGHPPGDEIYRNENYSVFEVDGNDAVTYCQNLCLLAKLYLDTKTLFYDVEPFLFYVLTINDNFGAHIVGYFSKEKYSAQKFNLSCIVVLPAYHHKGFGKFLIDFSYMLSRKEGLTGSPELPLSELGRISYESYWKSTVFDWIHKHVGERKNFKLEEICQTTGIAFEDIKRTLYDLNILSENESGELLFAIPDEALARHLAKKEDNTDCIRLAEDKVMGVGSDSNAARRAAKKRKQKPDLAAALEPSTEVTLAQSTSEEDDKAKRAKRGRCRDSDDDKDGDEKSSSSDDDDSPPGKKKRSPSQSKGVVGRKRVPSRLGNRRRGGGSPRKGEGRGATSRRSGPNREESQSDDDVVLTSSISSSEDTDNDAKDYRPNVRRYSRQGKGPGSRVKDKVMGEGRQVKGGGSGSRKGGVGRKVFPTSGKKVPESDTTELDSDATLTTPMKRNATQSPVDKELFGSSGGNPETMASSSASVLAPTLEGESRLLSLTEANLPGPSTSTAAFPSGQPPYFRGVSPSSSSDTVPMRVGEGDVVESERAMTPGGGRSLQDVCDDEDDDLLEASSSLSYGLLESGKRKKIQNKDLKRGRTKQKSREGRRLSSSSERSPQSSLDERRSDRRSCSSSVSSRSETAEVDSPRPIGDRVPDAAGETVNMGGEPDEEEEEAGGVEVNGVSSPRDRRNSQDSERPPVLQKMSAGPSQPSSERTPADQQLEFQSLSKDALNAEQSSGAIVHSSNHRRPSQEEESETDEAMPTLSPCYANNEDEDGENTGERSLSPRPSTSQMMHDEMDRPPRAPGPPEVHSGHEDNDVPVAPQEMNYGMEAPHTLQCLSSEISSAAQPLSHRGVGGHPPPLPPLHSSAPSSASLPMSQPSTSCSTLLAISSNAKLQNGSYMGAVDVLQPLHTSFPGSVGQHQRTTPNSSHNTPEMMMGNPGSGGGMGTSFMSPQTVHVRLSGGYEHAEEQVCMQQTPSSVQSLHDAGPSSAGGYAASLPSSMPNSAPPTAHSNPGTPLRTHQSSFGSPTNLGSAPNTLGGPCALGQVTASQMPPSSNVTTIIPAAPERRMRSVSSRDRQQQAAHAKRSCDQTMHSSRSAKPSKSNSNASSGGVAVQGVSPSQPSPEEEEAVRASSAHSSLYMIPAANTASNPLYQHQIQYPTEYMQSGYSAANIGAYTYPAPAWPHHAYHTYPRMPSNGGKLQPSVMGMQQDHAAVTASTSVAFPYPPSQPSYPNGQRVQHSVPGFTSAVASLPAANQQQWNNRAAPPLGMEFVPNGVLPAPSGTGVQEYLMNNGGSLHPAYNPPCYNTMGELQNN